MKSSSGSIIDIRLAMSCWLWRHGWGIVVVVTLLLGSAAGFAFKRHLLLQLQASSSELEALRVQISVLQTAPPAPVPASPEAMAYEALHAATYPAAEANGIVRRIHALSRANQVVIAESDYRMNSQGFGGLQQQQLTLPLQGKYPTIKAFTMQLLKEYPGLSVDQIVLQRDDVSRDKPEVTVKVSLWIRAAAQTPRQGSSSAAQ